MASCCAIWSRPSACRHMRHVKTGLPGMAYVRVDAEAEWPAELQVRLP